MPLLLAYPLWISLELIFYQVKYWWTKLIHRNHDRMTADTLPINHPEQESNLEEVLNYSTVKEAPWLQRTLSSLHQELKRNPNFSFKRYLGVSVLLSIFNLFSGWTW